MNIRALEAQALLQVFLVAHQHIDMVGDRAKHLVCTFCSTDRLPKLLAVVQVERADDTLPLSLFQRLDQKLRSRPPRAQRRYRRYGTSAPPG